MSASRNQSWIWNILKVGVAVLLVAGLFLLGVALTPPVPASHPVFAQPIAKPMDAGLSAPVNGNPGVNGTLASFTALIPQISTIYVPAISR